jgi:hypothetical protein
LFDPQLFLAKFNLRTKVLQDGAIIKSQVTNVSKPTGCNPNAA